MGKSESALHRAALNRARGIEVGQYCSARAAHNQADSSRQADAADIVAPAGECECVDRATGRSARIVRELGRREIQTIPITIRFSKSTE